jgi:hypothetical protein
MAQVVKCLPITCEALSTNPNTANERKKEKSKKEGRKEGKKGKESF